MFIAKAIQVFKLNTITPVILMLCTLQACNPKCDCNKMDRKTKDANMLFNICKYVEKAGKMNQLANPCKWKIRKKVMDTLHGKRIVRATMTCCYMGDEFVIDTETNKVIGFMASDK